MAKLEKIEAKMQMEVKVTVELTELEMLALADFFDHRMEYMERFSIMRQLGRDRKCGAPSQLNDEFEKMMDGYRRIFDMIGCQIRPVLQEGAVLRNSFERLKAGGR